jgi:hypothetical protein
MRASSKAGVTKSSPVRAGRGGGALLALVATPRYSRGAMADFLSLRDQVVVVTGAASGMGQI